MQSFNIWFINLLIIITLVSLLFNSTIWFYTVNLSDHLQASRRHNFGEQHWCIVTTSSDLRLLADYGEDTPVQLPGMFQPAAMQFRDWDEAYPLTDDHKWASIVPPKRGFVRLGQSGTPFSIALYHQLHCVNGIRFAYVAARDGLFKRPEDRKAAFDHVNHCFDVLRQSILCKADTTKIPVNSQNQTITRSCRDWTQVRDFVDENHEFWRGIPFSLTDINRSRNASSE